MSGRLAVVGAINVDLVVSSERLPKAGETVVGAGPQSFGGGKGANAAVAAARAGGEVLLIGAVGEDQAGAETLDRLAEEGVDVGGVARLDEEPTGVALIVVDASGENQIAVGAGANGALDADMVTKALKPRLAELGAVLVSTEIPDAAVLAAVDAAVAAGVCCVLNPAPPTPAVERSVGRGAILTPNEGELADLLDRVGKSEALRGGGPGGRSEEGAGAPGESSSGSAEGRSEEGEGSSGESPSDSPGRSEEGAGSPGDSSSGSAGRSEGGQGSLTESSGSRAEERAAALSVANCAPVIVTRGAEGVLIADGEETFEVPAPAADVVDTTGAGDTFNGVLATQLAAGDDLRTAAGLAVAAASISVGTHGARDGMPRAAEILAAAAD